MKIKHIAAIFAFFAAFALSVLLAGFPAAQGGLSKTPCVKSAPVVEPETELQVRIRKFLEADHQTGIEFANDMARLSQSQGRISAERIATGNLVEKMKKVRCVDLPEDFCRAWVEHRWTWETAADFQKSDPKAIIAQPGFRRHLNKSISQSYRNMLEAAQRHGVNFKF